MKHNGQINDFSSNTAVVQDVVKFEVFQLFNRSLLIKNHDKSHLYNSPAYLCKFSNCLFSNCLKWMPLQMDIHVFCELCYSDPSKELIYAILKTYNETNYPY